MKRANKQLRYSKSDAFQAAIGAIIGSIYVIILGATPRMESGFSLIVVGIWLALFYIGIKQLNVRHPLEHIFGTFMVCILVNTVFYILFGLITWDALRADFFGSPVFIVAAFLSFPVAIIFDIYDLSNIFKRYGWWTR